MSSITIPRVEVRQSEFDALYTQARESSFGELDQSDLRDTLRERLKEKIASENPDSYSYGWIRDVFGSFLITCEEGYSEDSYGSRYYKRSYTSDGTNIVIGDRDLEVELAWVPLLAIDAEVDTDSAASGEDVMVAEAKKTTGTPMKTDGGKQYSKSAYLITPNDEPSAWKVRVEETPGKVTVAQLGRAAAALTDGFRGHKVKSSSAEIARAKQTLVGLYHKFGAPLPSNLGRARAKESADGVFDARVNESFGEAFSVAAMEASTPSDDGKTKVVEGVVPIRPGVSINRNYYSATVLEANVECFDGLAVFFDHQTVRPKPLSNLVGVLENSRWDVANQVPRCDLRYFSSMEGRIEEVKEKLSVLGPDKVGLSIDMPVQARIANVNGQVVRAVESFTERFDSSVDIVWNPSAGGGFDRALEAASGEAAEMSQLDSMTLDQIQAARPDLFPTASEASGQATEANGAKGAAEVVDMSALEARIAETVAARYERTIRESDFKRELGKLKLSETLHSAAVREASAGEFSDENTQKVLNAFRDEKAKSVGGVASMVVVPGMPALDLRVTESQDIRYAALLGAAMEEDQTVNGKKIPRFTSLRRAVMAWHPELAEMAMFSPNQFAREAAHYLHWNGGELAQVMGGQATEAIISSTFNLVWADVMYKVLLQEIADPDLNTWRQLVSDIIPFSDLTISRKVIRVGEYPALSSVPEGAPYQDIANPTQEEVSFGVSKYGNTASYTWESALVDDLRALARIPRNLARAWTWTVYNFIFGLLDANSGDGATLDYDSKAIYDNTRSVNNYANSAFTVTGLVTATNGMRHQTDVSSGFLKRYSPKFLLHANDEALRLAIWEAVTSGYKVNPLNTSDSQNNLPNYVREVLGLEPVQVIYPGGSSTRCEIIASPRDAGTLAVGFLNGMEQPEIFVQDMDRVGSMFNSDSVTYKIRGVIGADVVDHRSFSRISK